VGAIEASKGRPLHRLLNALGIRHVGDTAAKAIARRFRSMEMLAAADEAALTEVRDIGPVVAASIAAFFRDDNNRSVLEKLREIGVNMTEPGAPVPGAGAAGGAGGAAVNPAIQGKSFVLTGTLNGLTREEATDAIEARGGHVVSSVTSKTDFVVVGEKPGSKLARARVLGIPVLTEEEFGRMLIEGVGDGSVLV